MWPGNWMIQSNESADLTLPLARFARTLQQANQLETAAEFFQRSVDASLRPAASKLAPQKSVLVRLAAGSVLSQTNKLTDAINVLRPTLSDESGASESQRQTAVSMFLRIGATALATGATATASEAYSLASKHADKKQQATAMLGDAWATAIRSDQPLDAARKLAAFVDRYPEHDDASRAARTCAECLKQAGRTDDASAMLADLLERWPDSESAVEVVRSHSELAVDLVPSPVCDWLIRKANANDVKMLNVKMTMLGILIATQRNELTAWGNLAKHLASIDQSGQTTSDLLASLDREGSAAEAERLAAMLIAPEDGGEGEARISAAAREAACRWAGRTLRWSMLALAADSDSPDRKTPSRTVAVERLFAESLMQTGRAEDARTWWNYLVDTRKSDDFSTLLRCAEAETAAGEDASVAEKRIVAARAAAGDNRFSIALVDTLDAELAIRRSQFDQARALLENVVRSNETDANLRGRAQWLIGETHYLQREFAAAIEGYRRVEGIDPGGIWVSASLVQAGKSFEQLGRTREAAVCYGNLLNRFADTAHAELARRRLAAIAPTPAHPKSTPPQRSDDERSSRAPAQPNPSTTPFLRQSRRGTGVACPTPRGSGDWGVVLDDVDASGLGTIPEPVELQPAICSADTELQRDGHPHNPVSGDDATGRR